MPELRRYSQKELAKKLDVGLSTYGKYERDEYQPKFETLLKICHYLQVTPNELLGYERELLEYDLLHFQVKDLGGGYSEVKANIPGSDEKAIFKILDDDLEIIMKAVHDDCENASCEAYFYNINLALARQLIKHSDCVQFNHRNKIIPKFALENSKENFIRLISALLREYPYKSI